jgi:hypothetical protein
LAYPCSELFEVDHIRTIYHMFIALLILFVLSTIVVDYIDEGRSGERLLSPLTEWGKGTVLTSFKKPLGQQNW